MPVVRRLCSLHAILARLRRDQRGVVVIYATVVLAAIMGMGALAIDGGRLVSLHSDMQSYADHAVLAAAGELDGNDGARERATTAAHDFVADAQKFATGGPSGLSLAGDPVYYSALPVSDEQPMSDGTLATSDADAAFVEVTVGPLQTDNILMAGLALAGLAPDMTGEATATAVAGGPNAERGRFVCDITPMMFCVPGGMDRETLRTWLPGRQIRLKAQSSWGPGAFGLLDVNFDPDGPCGTPNEGANFFRCAVAVEQSITRCFSRQGVDVRPGQASGPTESGFNARMDIYATSLQSKKNDPNFKPAPNVIKGVMPSGGGSCITGNIEETNAEPLPIESCLLDGPDGSCSGPSSRFSPSQTVDPTQRATYVQTNYTALGLPDKTAGATTRYEMFCRSTGSTTANWPR